MIGLRFVSLALGCTFLVKSPWISALFWVAILRDARFPLFALIGLAVADAVAWALGVDEETKRAGALRNNAIFASLAVAWLMTASGRPLEVQLAIEVSAAAGASLIGAAFVRGLRDTILPPLGWGFYIVAGVLFALFAAWTQSALVATVDWPRPNDALSWIQSFFRSLGMMLFLPKVEVGVLVFVAILLWSRLMLLSGTIGWICGVGIGLLLEREASRLEMGFEPHRPAQAFDLNDDPIRQMPRWHKRPCLDRQRLIGVVGNRDACAREKRKRPWQLRLRDAALLGSRPDRL